MIWSSTILLHAHLLVQQAQVPGNTSETVDWAVATVGHHIITHSDLSFEIALKPHFKIDFEPLQTRRNHPLKFLIDIKLLCNLGNSTDFYQIPPSILEENMAELRGRFETIQDFSAFILSNGMTESSLRETINCYLISEKVANRYVVTTQNSDVSEQYRLYEEVMNELWNRTPPRVIVQEHGIRLNTDD